MVDELIDLVKQESETRKALAKHVEKIYTILKKSKTNPTPNLEATNNVCGICNSIAGIVDAAAFSSML